MVLVDTDIMVDVLRCHQPAMQWIETHPRDGLTIPGYVLLELIEGCKDKAAQGQVLSLVSKVRVVWLSADGCDRAAALFVEHRLAHGLGMMDALVAQTALDLGATLASFNQKHYACVPELSIVEPYSRG